MDGDWLWAYDVHARFMLFHPPQLRNDPKQTVTLDPVSVTPDLGETFGKTLCGVKTCSSCLHPDCSETQVAAACGLAHPDSSILRMGDQSVQLPVITSMHGNGLFDLGKEKQISGENSV